MATKSTTSRDKVRAHRARLRRRGLRPIQIWVPDVRSRRFTREARRQSELVRLLLAHRLPAGSTAQPAVNGALAKSG